MSGFGRAGWFNRSEGDGGGGFEGDVVTIVVVVVVVVECVFNVNALYCVLIELVAFWSRPKEVGANAKKEKKTVRISLDLILQRKKEWTEQKTSQWQVSVRHT